jgi:outer membrane receptor protein involved in Fe transport
MKTLSAFFLFLILTTAAFAQQPPAGQKPPAGQAPNGQPGQAPPQGAPGAKPGGQGAGQAPPSIGRAYGKVTDSTGQPMAQASVILLKATTDPATKKRKLVLLKGTETKANGEFDFEDLPIVTQMVARISATGYKSQDVNVMIVPAQAAAKPGAQANSNPMGNLPSFDKDLGAIKLANDVKELSTATVTASAPAMKLELDKKVFNVEKNIVSAGGTAVDVMRNVPSVNVDIDGNVTLRGANPTIFVDGRPTTLSLDQIPADAIESVEVMTNPSAKYDASGGGSGILNIILKKNRKKGYNGNLTAGINSQGAPNALAGFNIRSGKVNVSANGMYNAMNGKTIGNTDRSTFFHDTTTRLLQTDLQRNKGHFLFGQLGLDWFVTNKTTLSASYIKVHGNFKPTDISDIQTDSIIGGQFRSTNYSVRNSISDRTFDVNGVNAGMKHLFAKEGEQITVDGSHFWVTSTFTSLYTTNYFQGQPGTPVKQITEQQQLGTAEPSFWTFQSDYTNPLTKTTKLEAGLRASIQKLDNFNYTYPLDGNGHEIPSPLGLSDYTSTSNVYAAYVNLTSGWNKFSYSVGLRGESSRYTGELRNFGQHFSNKYPVTLFPSLFLSQKLKNNQEVQFSATRKINRPGFFQLIPFTDYSDTLNITRGNPDLVPEFTNSFELSYMKTFPHNNTILISGYYKYTSNLITRYQDSATSPVGKSILINTYENANNAYTVGGEVTTTLNITRWWDASLNINVYNSHINTENLKQVSQDALWSWFGKFNSNFKLPANFSIQLTAIYQSKTNIPANQQQNQFGPPGSTTQSSSQGYIKPFGGVDIAVKKSFLKNNAASITLSMSDMFRTRWSKQYSQSQFFAQEYDRLKDPQLFRAVFTYRFGKMDLNLFKRKDMNSQGMGDAGGSLQ